eukprot:3935802-Amphidinium_carterae.1
MACIVTDVRSSFLPYHWHKGASRLIVRAAGCSLKMCDARWSATPRQHMYGGNLVKLDSSLSLVLP